MSVTDEYATERDLSRRVRLLLTLAVVVIPVAGLLTWLGWPKFYSPTAVSHPCGIAVDGSGNVYVFNNSPVAGGNGSSVHPRIVKVTPDGKRSVTAGNGKMGDPRPGPATASPLNGTASCTASEQSADLADQGGGLAVDAQGNLYVADSHVVEKVTPAGVLSIVARSGDSGQPVAGPATASSLESADSVAVDAAGNLYITDSFETQVAEVAPNGELSILAGTTLSGQAMGLVALNPVRGPSSVAVDPSGNVYIVANVASVNAGPVYQITTAGKSFTVKPASGTYNGTYNRGVATDPGGNVYLTDGDRVTKIAPDGKSSIVAGNGATGRPVAGTATSSPLSVVSLTADRSGNIYLAGSGEIVKVTPDGVLSVVAHD